MIRSYYNQLFTSLSCLAAMFCLTILCFLLVVIISQGLPALSFEFISSPARSFGAEGGILFQLLGSLLLIVCAGLISLPIGLGVAIYKSEYLQNSSGQHLSHLLLYALNAVPSVVFGIFGLIFFVNILHTGLSWFVGSIILAFMILPTITVSLYWIKHLTIIEVVSSSVRLKNDWIPWKNNRILNGRFVSSSPKLCRLLLMSFRLITVH